MAIVLMHSIYALGQIPRFSDDPDKIRLKGKILAEGDSYSQIVLTYDKETLKSISSLDTKIFPLEKMQIYVQGEANLCPCDIRKKKKRFLQKSKRWMERRNHFMKAQELEGKISLKLNNRTYNPKISADSTHLVTNLQYDPGSNYFGKDIGLNFEGFVSDDSFCLRNAAVRHNSYTEYEVIVDIDLKPRLEGFKVFLENTPLQPTIINMQNWLDSRLVSKYGYQISEFLAKKIDKSTMSDTQKVNSLEYIVANINSSNPQLKNTLGITYYAQGDYLKCVETFKELSKEITSPKNIYKSHNLHLSNTIGEVFEKLAICIVLRNQGLVEEDLNRAFSSYDQAAFYFIASQNTQKYFDLRIRQLHLLKKINEKISLEKALGSVDQFIDEWGKNDENDSTALGKREIIPIDLSNHLLIRTSDLDKWKITDSESLAKILQEYPNNIFLRDEKLIFEADEILLENETSIIVSNTVGAKELVLKTKNLVLGNNVSIKYLPEKAIAKGKRETEELEIADETNTVISFPPDNPTGLVSLKNKYKGIEGLPGNNGTTTQFKISLIGGVSFVGKGFEITNIGQEGGDGGNGGDGRKFNYTKRQGLGETIVNDRGFNGTQGNGGRGGKGGEICVDLHFFDNIDTEASKKYFKEGTFNFGKGADGLNYNPDDDDGLTEFGAGKGSYIANLDYNLQEFFQNFFQENIILLEELTNAP